MKEATTGKRGPDTAGRDDTINNAHAVSVRYDYWPRHFIIGLRGGMALYVPADLLEGVAEGTADQIADVEVLPGGHALHWKELDVEFTIQDIVIGSLGSRQWMEDLREVGGLDVPSQERLRLLAERDGPLPKREDYSEAA
jgi:hypothetical protein